jgi:cell division protein FtsB
MWMTMILNILKNPKNIIIVLLLAASGYLGALHLYEKGDIVKLQNQVLTLTSSLEAQKKVNQELTQNRDALLIQIQNLQDIEKKAQDLQNRIDALKKTCAKPVPGVVVKPTPPAAPGIISTPGVATPPTQEGNKPVETTPAPETGTITGPPVPETYYFGGYDYEKEAKGIYNDVILWFNSSELQPKNKPSAMSNPPMPSPIETDTQTIGHEQNDSSPGQFQPSPGQYECYRQIFQGVRGYNLLL